MHLGHGNSCCKASSLLFIRRFLDFLLLGFVESVDDTMEE